jgi:hypothetical protein
MRYIKILFFLIFLATHLQAKAQSATYEISYGFFGAIGEATFFKEIVDNHYTIRVSAKPYGFAKKLSGNHQEFLTSKGIIKNQIYIPHTYTKEVKTNSKYKQNSYTFNHKQKSIIKNGKKRHHFYLPNDLLTLYFNIHHPHYRDAKRFYALGGATKTGKVSVRFSTSQDKTELKKMLKLPMDKVVFVKVWQSFFSMQLGEMMINLDKKHFPKEIYMKDAIVFGDIYAKLK